MEKFKAPDESESKLHFLDYWRIIRIRKTVILAVFLLVAITTTAVTYALPKYYKGTTRIRVEKDTPDIDELMGRPTAGGFDPYWIQTEFEVITSRSILNEVIRKLDLTHKWAERYDLEELELEDTYNLLRSDLEVSQYRNTSLIKIEAFSRDKNEAADIANTVADVYRQSRIKLEQERGRKGIETLREELEKQNQLVAEAEDEVNKLRDEYDIVDTMPDVSIATQSVDIDKVKLINQRLVVAQNQHASIEALLKKLKSFESREELIQALPTAVSDGQLSDLMSALNRTNQELSSQLETLTGENPQIKKIQALKNKIEQQIEDRVDGILAGLETKAASYKAEIDNLQENLDEAKRQDIQTAQQTRPYQNAKRRLENMTRLRDVLSLKIQQEEIDLNIPRSSIVTVTDEAIAEKDPVRPNMALNVVLGCIVGLIVGVGLAFFIEYLDTSVKTIDDVERALQAPVLGVIPQNVGSLLEEGTESPHAEAYRVLRTNLLFSRKDEKSNTITVVSGGAGEGKSTTLFNLATVFAQNGDRVLIVDSDLRRPSIHKILGVSNSLGLTNYLMKTKELEEVIQTTELPTMDMMPSGKLPSSSLGILNSPRMKELVDTVKNRYDYIFFDSPPIMGVSDASILASLVDISVQVIQYRKYPQAMTIRAKQLVEKIGKNLLGIVLNNINMSQDSDYYYYSGYYYDYYYSKSDDAKEEEETKKAKKNGDSGSSRQKPRMDLKQKY